MNETIDPPFTVNRMGHGHGDYRTRSVSATESPYTAKDFKTAADDLWESLRAATRGNPPVGVIREVDQQERAVLRGCQNVKFGSGFVLPMSNPDFIRALVPNIHATGGALIPTTIAAAVSLPRPASRVEQAGAIRVTGIVGDIAWPKELTETNFSWFPVAGTPSDSDGTWGQIASTPHRICGTKLWDWQLEAQSKQLIPFIVDGMRRGIGVAKDEAALVGVGVAGQPLGLFNNSSVNTVVFSGAPTWTLVQSFISQITGNDAPDEELAWILAPAVKSKWALTQRFSNAGETLFGDSNDGNTIAGKAAFVSTNVANTDVVCGWFQRMAICEWGEGATEIVIDRYSNSRSGQTRIVATAYVDVAVLNANCFSRNSGSAVQ